MHSREKRHQNWEKKKDKNKNKNNVQNCFIQNTFFFFFFDKHFLYSHIIISILYLINDKVVSITAAAKLVLIIGTNTIYPSIIHKGLFKSNAPKLTELGSINLNLMIVLNIKSNQLLILAF